MKRMLLLIFTFSVLLHCHAQQKIQNYEIGYGYDINNQAFMGYFDFDYAPKRVLKEKYDVYSEFAPGYYFDLNNNKIYGYLKYNDYKTNFNFKNNPQDKQKLIKADECNGFVIGLETYAVFDNFKVEMALAVNKISRREFLEVIDSFENLTFYKHTTISFSSIVETYFYKADTSSGITSFPKAKSKFIETALPVFSKFELLKRNILSGKYDQGDIEQLINLLKYYYKFEKGEKIYYNFSWDEIENQQGSFYYANIDSVHDSIFHLKYYFNNNIPIFEGSYASFYPPEKTGEFIWYYPNGNVRKRYNYTNNKKQRTFIYHPNGNIHYEYVIVDEDKFYSVYDVNGLKVLDNAGSGIENFYDSINNRLINCEFLNYKFLRAYYHDENNRVVYLSCEDNAKFKSFVYLQDKLSITIKYPIESFKRDNQGLTLVKCIVEPTGYTSKIEIIRSIDPDCDSLVYKLLSHIINNKSWKPGKVNNTEIAQEVIIPIDFSINRLSLHKGLKNAWKSNQWNHFNQFHQWNHQQSVKIPNLPRM